MSSKSIKPKRNGPCPCGSGKKFKKCCYGKLPSKATPIANPPSRQVLVKDLPCKVCGSTKKSLMVSGTAEEQKKGGLINCLDCGAKRPFLF